MSQSVNNHTRRQYAAFSADAVSAERKADYLTAASLWHKAGLVARCALNRSWTEQRGEFCRKAADKGWGKPDESAAV
jgi:hypothetical protein